MTVISYLLLSVALFFVTILVQALGGVKQYGLVTLAGPREGLAEPNAFLGRAKRTTANMAESMVMFVPLALLAIHTGSIGSNVALGAALFFWGRLVYAPLYWFGVSWLRTLAWTVSIVGILLMFLSLMTFI